MRGDPWCGRPARYVRRQTIIGSTPFTYLPRCLLTSKRVRTHTNKPHWWTPTSAMTHSVDFHVIDNPRHRLPRHRQPAALAATFSSSHGIGCHIVDGQPPHHICSPFPPSLPTPTSSGDVTMLCIHNRHQTSVHGLRPGYFHMTFLTSQACTAVSIDTRTALARFTGHFMWDTHKWVYVPVGL